MFNFFMSLFTRPLRQTSELLCVPVCSNKLSYTILEEGEEEDEEDTVLERQSEQKR